MAKFESRVRMSGLHFPAETTEADNYKLNTAATEPGAYMKRKIK